MMGFTMFLYFVRRKTNKHSRFKLLVSDIVVSSFLALKKSHFLKPAKKSIKINIWNEECSSWEIFYLYVNAIICLRTIKCYGTVSVFLAAQFVAHVSNVNLLLIGHNLRNTKIFQVMKRSHSRGEVNPMTSH